METNEIVLVDEREIVTKFANKAKELNPVLMGMINKTALEMGIVPSNYVGGLTAFHWYEKLPLENNINNLFATFCENYSNSVFYQCSEIRLREMINLVETYLTAKGLADDFGRYKQDRTKKQQKDDALILNLLIKI